MRRTLPILIAGVTLTACATASAPRSDTPEPSQPAAAENPSAMTPETLAAWMAEQTETLARLELAAQKAWWEASTTGSDEAFARSKAAADEADAFLADPERFAVLEAALTRTDLEPLLARQVVVLHREMLGKQVDPALLQRITALENEVEQAFNTYRGTIGGEPVTQNRIEQVLRTAVDDDALRGAWEAQKGVGPMVAPKLRELVKLRNEVARRLGYRDFWALRLAELDLDEDELLAIFDSLDALTRAPFLALKAEVDRRLAERYGIGVEALRPWHYHNPFFQEPPDVFETGLDAAYRDVDVAALARRYYEGLGLEVEGVLARSDLYEKPGKTPHAFAVDIDRGDDVRILTNIVPGIDWTTTTVHELGHAVYDVYLDRDLPWLLRSAAHPLTTEGLAMMMDRQVSDPTWAREMGVMDAEAAARARAEAERQLAFSSLVFSRWTQVMLHFERSMYADPDQDLNALWWDLVEKYQALTRPEGRDAPDYASKIHLVIVPVYYQNYMLGELFAAQLHERIAEREGIAPAELVYVDRPAVGQFLSEQLFAPGMRWPWAELVERVTGRPLGAEAFARRFEAFSRPEATASE